jgi:hypothetical protein
MAYLENVMRDGIKNKPNRGLLLAVSATLFISFLLVVIDTTNTSLTEKAKAEKELQEYRDRRAAEEWNYLVESCNNKVQEACEKKWLMENLFNRDSYSKPTRVIILHSQK